MKLTRLLMALCLTTFIVGCSSEEERLKASLTSISAEVGKNVQNLRHHIGSGRIKNAKLLEEYAKVVKNDRPEMSAIVDTLAEDSGAKGPMFRSLITRLREADQKIDLASQNRQQAQMLADEYKMINTAASVSNYNMALTDPLNVLADMSGGKLARVADLAAAAASSERSSVGAELVGNPSYGNWQTNSSGDTFWEWYGKYALFSQLIGGPMSYSDWSTHRRPSYYHDRGRHFMSSPGQKRSYQATENRVKKSFASKGKSFKSPYAKTSSTKTAVAKPTLKTASKFNSNYSNKSVGGSGSSYSSKPSSSYSSRSFGSGGSRSFGSGGK